MSGLVTTRRAAVVAAVAGGLYMLKQQQDAAKKAARRAKAAAENGGDSNNKKKKKKKGPDPMLQIFWRLWPFGHSPRALKADPDAQLGQMELIAIFAMSVLRTWHQNRMVYVKRDLMQATYHRDRAQFRSVIRQTAVLSVLSSLIFAAHRYLKERLTLVWRTKLTRSLHRHYLQQMNYYKLSHMNKSEIADVEERITRDPRRFCKGLADEMEKLSAAMTSGIFFTYKLATISSPLFAVSPLIYFYVAFQASVSLAPNWSKRWRTMLDKRAIYQKNHSRLLSHSEAIAAYQGGERERGIIEKSWVDFLDYCIRFVRDASLFHFVTSGFFEHGAHSMAQALIVGKFVGDSSVREALSKARTSKEKVAANAALFSHIRFLTEYFIRAMSAQGTIIAVLRTVMNMRGPAKRLTELFNTMDRFEKQREISTTFKNDPAKIAFENVQVYTPTGHLLVKDLNFHIDKGTSMLLTGVNGSGKSSIFRCLGSLWPVPAPGVITKPGGGEPGLNKDVFYLPQKPYVALGSLQANLLYPELEHEVDAIPDDQVEALLHKVDLGYLLDRAEVRDNRDDVDWDAILSLGEKQRLAMARVFYHRPSFLILDECSSGVSSSLERRFYTQLEEEGVTCITISHRPVLERYHDVVLNILGDGLGGWEWRETTRGKAKFAALADGCTAAEAAERAAKAASADSGESGVGGYSAAYFKEATGDALVERERLRKRSEPYTKAAAERKLRKVSTLQRLKDLMHIFLPNGMDLGRDTEAQRVALLAGLIVGKTLLADAIARFDGLILNTVMQSKFSVFARAMVAGAIARTFLAGFDALMMKHKWYLNLAWRARLTKALHDLYFRGLVFYDVQNHDTRIPDPDERIAEQVETLSISLTELWTSLLKPAFDITFNTIMLYRVVGKGMIYMVGYMGGAALVMRYIVPNYRSLVRREQELEGRFRSVHNRLTMHTESVAFFGGDDVEHAIASHRLEDLAGHVTKSQMANFRFQILQNFSIKQVPDLVAFALRMAFATGFSSDDAVLTSGASISSTGEYIQQVVMATFKSFGDAFDLAEQLGQFAGTLDSVTDFLYVLQDLAQQREAKNEQLKPSTDGSIEFDNVDIVAPSNLCVASNLSFKVNPGQSLIVTGPNAAGKSSLFRTLAGLWPIPPKGSISRPCGPDGLVTPDQVFLVPQKPYSVQGSLASQICYPEEMAEEDFTEDHDRHFRELLGLVGIEYLADREGWFTVRRWEDTLSLGEQQRIGIARLFYHSPQFAVIDEATSAVSVDAELKAYKLASEGGVTLITISQRLALPEYHKDELQLGDSINEDGWRIEELHS